MADGSTIEWTEATWNPTTGCDRVSAGCDNFYALTLAKRLKAMGAAKYQNDGDPRTSGPGFGVTLHKDVLALPYRWRTPRVVFVNSMSDLSGGLMILTARKSLCLTAFAGLPCARRMSGTGRPQRFSAIGHGNRVPVPGVADEHCDQDRVDSF